MLFFLSGEPVTEQKSIYPHLLVVRVVDFGTKLLYAIECKFTNQPSTSHLSGLRSFHGKHPDVPCYIVAPVNQPSRLSFARVLPPHKLLQEL